MKNRPNVFKIIILIITLCFISNCLADGQSTNKSPGADKWQNLRFGLMMHWGLYSVAGGVWNG